MGRNRYSNKRHPPVMLDAGYVSVRTIDLCTSSELIGLHGKKFFCVISTVLILFSISFINLTCLLLIMYKLDWTPLHQNGSNVFRFDQLNQHIEFYHRGTFNEAIYTTKIRDVSQIDISLKKQIDIYGDHNSILLDEDQISMNTETFYINDTHLVDFSNLQLYKFDDRRRTRIHHHHVNSQYIHSEHLKLTANDHLTISKVNEVLFSGRNLTIEAHRNNRRSVVRFGNYARRKKHLDRRQKISYGNLKFRIDSMYFDLSRASSEGNTRRSDSDVYRICICNTTFLLLRSFAHQPCPLC